MIPRYLNPHRLLDHTKLASRAEIYNVDSDEDVPAESSTPETLLLDQRLREELQVPLGRYDDQTYKRKRTKLNTDVEENQVQQLPFRLVSSRLDSQVIWLTPKPPPPVKSIEPECEDNPIQAKIRKERSQSAAVDAQWVFDQSSIEPCVRTTKIIRGTVYPQLPSPHPAIFITEISKPSRNTRPPILASRAVRTKTHPIPKSHPERLVIPIDITQTQGTLRRPRTRRRRQKRIKNTHPQPTFWRPNPEVRGNSLGYALGYPGNWASYDSRQGRYKRDTMKTGVYIDNI